MQAVVLSNRREAYLPGALVSLGRLDGVDRVTIVDDSGDAAHRAHLRGLGHEVVDVAPEPAGYGRAMQAAFDAMDGEHVLFWEEDFRLLAPVDLNALAGRLDADPSLAQVALLRGPWFANEHDHGGVIEARQAQGAVFQVEDGLIVHTDHYTANPSVLPRRTFTRPWPQQAWSESAFTRVLTRAGHRFAYLPGVTVDHIGVRDGHGY